MKKWGSLSIAVAALTFASAAFGQAQDPREIQARKDCLTGKVESGVALLAELFIQTKKPNLIYNQGRCFEQNGRPEEAINRFREYLRVAKNLNTQEKAETEKHIADCRALVAEQRSETAPGPASPAQVPGPAPTPPPPVQAAAPVEPRPAGPTPGPGPSAAVGEALHASPAQSAEMSNLRLAGIIVGGSSIAALATGGIFSILVSNAKQKAEDNAKGGFYDSSLNSRGKSYETMQWVFYGVGGGLLATGALLYVLGAQDKGERTSVSLLPSVAPGTGGVILRGGF